MKNIKIINRRLNDNTVISIEKHKNEFGGECHHVVLHYEDTKEQVDFGMISLSSAFIGKIGCDEYSYNDNYIVVWKYDYEQDMLDLKNVFDINARCELLTDNGLGNYFTSVDAERDIETYKYKGKRLSSSYRF